jgi:hypothetical protein
MRDKICVTINMRGTKSKNNFKLKLPIVMLPVKIFYACDVIMPLGKRIYDLHHKYYKIKVFIRLNAMRFSLCKQSKLS